MATRSARPAVTEVPAQLPDRVPAQVTGLSERPERPELPASAAGRPLRSDAQINRQRILAAAGRLMAERGLTVPLEDITLAAGVGVGTLYRRFPTRDGLIVALFEERLDEFANDLQASFAIEDGWDALVWCLRRSTAQRIADRALSELLEHDTITGQVQCLRETLEPLIARLIERAKASGKLRQDFEIGDFAMVQKMLAHLGTMIESVLPEVWERYLALLLDGMQCDHPVPGLSRPPAPTLEQLDALFQQGKWGGRAGR